MNNINKLTLDDYHKLLDKACLVTSKCYEAFDTIIDNLTYDSNSVTAGMNTLFVCKGAAFKREYLVSAIDNGAIAYISEQDYSVDLPHILVSDIRKAMPILADAFYGSPWKDLNLIGITGTKGKSTTAYYLKSVIDTYLQALNKPASAVISSIDVYDGVINKESHITTPEAMELQMHFRNAVNSNIEYLEMEVSSQALKYNRVDNMTFDIGMFLNISEDHISPIEHADFEDYFSSKLRIFKQTKTAIVNMDSDYSERILSEALTSQKVVTFGTIDTKADIFGYNIVKHKDHISFMVKTASFDKEFILTMPGLFNVENALATIACSVELNIPVEYIYEGLKIARSSGRMEMYSTKDKNVIAIVDYAHNKLSFEKLFSSMREEYPDYNIISIFGCPGKKAFIRRKDLGTVAGMYSKMVYLVAEDPGYESVEAISKDIAQYVEAQNCPYKMIENRGEAIYDAIMNSGDKALLLITGKGNETRQKYGNQYLDCVSDVNYVKEYIAEYNEMHNL